MLIAPVRTLQNFVSSCWRSLPVHWKFQAAVVPMICALMVGTFLILQGVFIYQERKALGLKHAMVSASHSLLLAAPLRIGDKTSVRRLIATIIADPAFERAWVVTPDGQTLTRVGVLPLESSLSHIRSEPIKYVDMSGIVTLGTLHTQASENVIRTRLDARSHELAIFALLLAVGLVVGVYLAYRRIVQMPLDRIAASVESHPTLRRPTATGLSKHDDLGRLGRSIDASRLNQWRMSRRLTKLNAGLESAIAIRTQELSTALAELNSKTDAIEKLAMTDTLTGLPNRRALSLKLKELAEGLVSNDAGQLHVCMAMIDLDNFKHVNDLFGHPVGDAVLQEAAKRLRNGLDGVHTVARLGGDEFAVIVPSLSTSPGDQTHACRVLGERLVELLRDPVTVKRLRLPLGGSVGVSSLPIKGLNPSHIMSEADLAMYRSKENGKGKYQVFDKSMRAGRDRDERLIGKLRHAIDTNTIDMHYQPQILLKDGSLTGVEALVRWTTDDGENVPPIDLLRLASWENLIKPLGLALARRVADDVDHWLDKGLTPGSVAINLHPVELRDANHMEVVADILGSSQLPATSYVLEVTEDCVVGADTGVIDTLSKLRARGFGISLDDFGTGYASLQHLCELPITEFKIDRSFVIALTDSKRAAVTSALAYIAKNLDLKVVAEGIETEAHRAQLLPLGNISGQGYGLGMPQPTDELVDLLADGFQTLGPLRLAS